MSTDKGTDSKSLDKKSFRSRMGTVMRRTSSIVTLGAVGSRPTTPQQQSEPLFPRRASVASTSDVSSLGSQSASARPSIELNTAAAAAAAASSAGGGSHVPSPIAESPARELAAASEDDGAPKRHGTLGVSPLSQAVTTSEDVEGSATATGVNTPQIQPEPASETAPIYDAPPRIFEEATGPGAFVDEPEEMSLKHGRSIDSLRRSQEAPVQPEVTHDAAPPAAAPEPAQQRPDHSPELKTAVDDPGYFTITAPEESRSPQFQTDSASLHEAIIRNTMGDEADASAEAAMASQTTPRPHGPADTENANMFYVSPNPVPVPAPAPVVEEQKAGLAVMPEAIRLESDATVRGTPPSVPPSIPQPVVDPAPAPAPAPVPAPAVPHVEMPKSKPIPIPSFTVAEPQAVWAVSLSGSDGKKHVPEEEYRGSGNGSARYEDPFADPVPSHPAPPAVTAYPVEVTMPAPRSAREEVHGYMAQREREHEHEHEHEHAPPPPVIVVPLPESTRLSQEDPFEKCLPKPLGQSPGKVIPIRRSNGIE
ncbi:hypothetical protein MPER_10113 [Moniliophthora perniciosa FA553]|nr:hypothetical protein MPER_10113 [Moniliophthora perniciosa FA553]